MKFIFRVDSLVGICLMSWGFLGRVGVSSFVFILCFEFGCFIAGKMKYSLFFVVFNCCRFRLIDLLMICLYVELCIRLSKVLVKVYCIETTLG